MAIFYWLLYGLKWKWWRIYNFCCNLFWVYGSIDWTIWQYVISARWNTVYTTLIRHCFQRYNDILGVQYNPVRAGMELTTLVVIDSVWIASCKFNYYMTTATRSHVLIITLLLLCKYIYIFLNNMLICSRRSKAVRTTRCPRCRNRITGTQKSSKNI